MQSIFVYLIVNLINEKGYIGISNNPKVRFKNHCNWKCSHAISSAIIKYGKQNFDLIILAECRNYEEAFELEKKFITEYETLSPLGYNITSGGEGAPGNTNHSYKRINEQRWGLSVSNKDLLKHFYRRIRTKGTKSFESRIKWILVNCPYTIPEEWKTHDFERIRQTLQIQQESS